MAEQLHFIRKYAFNSSSLQQLYFRDNAFHFSIDPPNFYPGSLFKNSPSLQLLDLSGNLFKHNETVMKQMLGPLTNLESLFLVDCNLHYLPRYIFGVLPNLRQLYLQTNMIVEWNGHDVFGNSTTLRYIDLSKNHIVVVNKTLFPGHLLQYIEFIELQHNPFSCNCKEVKWFHDWMIENRQKLCPMRRACKKLVCASPSHLKNEAIVDLTESEMCPIPEYSKVLVIAITSCFICVLMVTLIIYKARWHIRYLIYMYRFRRNGYEAIAGQEGFDYDAFVIYAEEDQEFVHKILVPTLEDREGYHLCIHYRDFQVGKLIADNIVNSIQKSRKVIVILSNSFARSKWCDFELIIAQNRLILEQNNLLVVILIEKIEPKNITNSLRLILSTVTYADWNACGTEGEKESFWNQVRHSFKK
ncbi:toll-like receptor 4 [Saccostrea echinata]|uniref:toll-like receptor 4 n=1 Tax=Saccostrea echinata TaxID=191078 RepID=UPI002A82A5E3|nr:toll-like receptor 4 [Saccostrea echinata]